eukprot:TRINITY_DN504_c0_g1_i1.p1 TRINITY_DN504_c0_g1~~TRINITY_DN504_c0_g1_i1.p1  ORF type:complete len:169 (+),score=16.38 TRINITY_DN504_c0_g1_i1:259-765(+)
MDRRGNTVQVFGCQTTVETGADRKEAIAPALLHFVHFTMATHLIKEGYAGVHIDNFDDQFVGGGDDNADPHIHGETFWLPDDFSRVCMNCGSEFGLFRRRHHCRTCGVLICSDCSRGAFAADAEKRVCPTCHDHPEHLLEENFDAPPPDESFKTGEPNEKKNNPCFDG